MIKTLVAIVYNDSMFCLIFIIALSNDNMRKSNSKHTKKTVRIHGRSFLLFSYQMR